MSKIPMPEAPEGYEWVEADIWCYANRLEWNGKRYELHPKQKRYDWSKTANYVWVYVNRGEYQPFEDSDKRFCEHIHEGWLPHFGGPCPFDEEAVIVEVIYRSGAKGYGIADKFYWDHDKEDSDIIAVRFVKLIDGYTF
jgi:hypothetical protein